MSVLVKGLEMPKSCDECRIMTLEDTNCVPELFCGCPIVFKAHPQGKDYRPDYCPLIPAADVRPVVRGRDICDTVKGHCEFKCSVCGVELSSVYGGNNDFGLDGGHFNYCPNCGADMREVTE